MSLDTEYEDEENSEEETEGPKGLRKRLSKAETEARDASSRAQAAERKLAFLEAGIPSTAKFS